MTSNRFYRQATDPNRWPGPSPMTHREATNLANGQAGWLLKCPGVKSVGVCRQIPGKTFKGIPIQWMLQISGSSISEATKNWIKKKLPNAVIDWNESTTLL